jgi:hypothetical protein
VEGQDSEEVGGGGGEGVDGRVMIMVFCIVMCIMDDNNVVYVSPASSLTFCITRLYCRNV